MIATEFADLLATVVKELSTDGKLVMSSTLACAVLKSERFIKDDWKKNSRPGEKCLVGWLEGLEIFVDPFMNPTNGKVYDGSNNLLYAYEGDVFELEDGA